MLCLPGVEVLGFGFDVLTGKLPREAQPVVKFTFSQSKQYANLKNTSMRYNVPDQVTVVDGRMIDTEATASISYSASQYAHSQAKGFQFDGNIPFKGATLSLSAGVTDADSKLKERKSYSSYAHLSLFGTLFQASLVSAQEAHEDFTKNAFSLPEEYDKERYMEFISMYGTHYVSAGYFGGFGQMAAAVNSEETQEKDKSWVSHEANVHFDFLKNGGSASGHTDATDKSFIGKGSSTTYFSTKLVGGDPQLVGEDLSKWQQWVSSWWQWPTLVYKDTYPLSLSPIEKLLPKSAEAIRSNIQKVITDYSNSHPYPDDPNCMEKVLTPEGTCCSKDEPHSCNGRCYETEKVPCGRNCIDPSDICCDDKETSCSSSQQCCSHSRSGCIGADDTCCKVMTGYCTSDYPNCCDNHPECDFCCPPGHACAKLVIIGCGCNPLTVHNDSIAVPGVTARKGPAAVDYSIVE